MYIFFSSLLFVLDDYQSLCYVDPSFISVKTHTTFYCKLHVHTLLSPNGLYDSLKRECLLLIFLLLALAMFISMK